MTRPLLDWVADPLATRGLHFARDDGSWDRVGYDELAASSRAAAAVLRASGMQPNCAVAIVARSGRTFASAFFGALLAGGRVSPIAPPMILQDPGEYGTHLASVLRAADVEVVLTESEYESIVRQVAIAAVPAARVVVMVEEYFSGEPWHGCDPGSVALVQFTSGSSGHPKGVRVPFEALEANVAVIGRWLSMCSDDGTATWLPFHHDMGLVGCFVSPVVHQMDVWVMQPEEFVQRPLRYLSCLGDGRAQLTAMPNFGLDFVIRRVRPADLQDLDFSGWRALILGAERVDPMSIERFHALLAPHGFSRQTLLPAYGLAEATLAVTGVPIGEELSYVRVRTESLRPGGAVVLDDAERGGDISVHACCGRPLSGTTVTVVDDAGLPLPEDHVGEITVDGPSVAAGYMIDAEGGSLTSFKDGHLNTGDAGFLHGGHLVVLGRLGDGLNVRGRLLLAESLEAELRAAGLNGDRLTVLLGSRLGSAVAVVVLESLGQGAADIASRVVRGRTGDIELVVVDAPRKTIARTSSGKPKRRQLFAAFLEGRLVDGQGERQSPAVRGRGDRGDRAPG